jgi:hypothetical protein
MYMFIQTESNNRLNNNTVKHEINTICLFVGKCEHDVKKQIKFYDYSDTSLTLPLSVPKRQLEKIEH